MTNIKVIFLDLDDTVIKTLSGKTFPEGVWDFKPNFPLWDKLKTLKGVRVLYIVSNQGGIEKGFLKLCSFKAKLNFICEALRDYTGIPTSAQFCTSLKEDCKFRKPNTGMLEEQAKVYKSVYRQELKKDECLMIGDASGKEGDFSDSDLRTAENFGIAYKDVDDFIKDQS